MEAPSEKPPNVIFDISWKEWFIVWPFKEYSIVSKITRNNNGDTVDFSYKLKHWWFWGNRTHLSTEWNGISEDTEYQIKVGYKDG